MSRIPSQRHIHVYVWSHLGAHHWRVTQGRVAAQGEVDDCEQAWACALSAMHGAIKIGQLADYAQARKGA